MAWWKRKGQAEARSRRENSFEVACARLRDGDQEVRAEAARELVRLGDRRAVPVLCEAVAGESWWRPVRSAAAIVRALAEFGGVEAESAVGAELRKEVAWHLQPSGADDSPPSSAVADCIIPALRWMGGPSLVVRALLDTMRSKTVSRPVKASAARQLKNWVGSPSWRERLTEADRELMVESLRAALRDDEDAARDEIASVLGHLGDARALPELLDMLWDRISEVRRCAAEALGRLGDQRAVPALKALEDDIDPRVRAAVGQALRRLAGRSSY